jgi:hypothetical protein
MRAFIATLGLWLFGCTSAGADTAKLSMDTVTRVVASPNGKFVAVLDEAAGGPAVHVVSCCASSALVFTVGRNTLARYVEEPQIDSVEWSADGRLLKIGFNDREEDYGVVVVDPTAGLKSLKPVMVGDAPAAWGSWSTTGHRLYVRPGSESDDGIYVVDPVAGTSTRLVKGYRAAVEFSVTEHSLMTKVEKVTGDVITYSLVRIDLKTGTVTELEP